MLFQYSYSQLPYRNSRRIEKQKRIRNRILAYQANVKQKLTKIIRTKLTKAMYKKIGTTNKKEESTHFIKNLSETLIQIVDKESIKRKNFREILRELETHIAEVILNDTNKQIKSLLVNLINPTLINTTPEIASNKTYTFNRTTTFIRKTPMSQANFARKFTSILKANGFECYKNKDLKNIKFDPNIFKYLKQNNIKLTVYPSDITLNENLKKKLIKMEEKPKKGAIENNYKCLIDHF
jgi:hypothetical protein